MARQPSRKATCTAWGGAFSTSRNPETVLYVSDTPALAPDAPYEIHAGPLPQVDMANFRTGVRVVFPQGLSSATTTSLFTTAPRTCRWRPRASEQRDLVASIEAAMKREQRGAPAVKSAASASPGPRWLHGVRPRACRWRRPAAAPPPLAVRFDHLRHLGLDAVVNGRPVRVVALYAEAPDYRPTGSPARDGYEGIASVDDAARAAVVYLRAYEETGDARASRRGARPASIRRVDGAGRWRVRQFHRHTGAAEPRRAEQPQEHVVLGGAQCLGAGGSACACFGRGDPARAAGPARPALDRAVARIAREVDAGRLIGGSATATSEALLGLLALQRAEPSPARAALAARTAELLVPLSAGTRARRHRGARGSIVPTRAWHAWGSRSTAALATAAVVLERPDFLVAATQEADALWSRFLLAGRSRPRWRRTARRSGFRRSRTASGPIVEGYLALAEATRTASTRCSRD